MNQKHKDEILRFANSKQDVCVWQKEFIEDEWKKYTNASWLRDTMYIVDDAYAEIRKAQADGKTIERLNISNVWVECNNCKFTENIFNGAHSYRIKTDEPTYYYQWERLEMNNKRIVTSPFYVSDFEATQLSYEDKGWRKIESSKREW